MASPGSASPAVYALYPLRIVVAAVFLVMGFNKFADLSGTATMFDAWGIPLPAVSSFLVAVAEFFGGLGILAGVLTRFSAAVLSVVMLTAMFAVKFGTEFSVWSLDLAMLGGLVTLLLNGPGRPTLQSIWTEWKERRTEQASPGQASKEQASTGHTSA